VCINNIGYFRINMVKTIKILVIAYLCPFYFLFAQDTDIKPTKLSPMIKSAIFPGWGEHALGKNSRGNIFITSELIGIALATYSFVNAKNISTNYQAFASEHAAVDEMGKNHQFWVDIGNFNSRNAYNEDRLRNDLKNLYPDETIWQWNWDSLENREEFEEMRIKSDRSNLIGKFFLGGIVLNHILSVIDVYYLKNVALNEKVKLSSYYNHANQELIYSIQFKL